MTALFGLLMFVAGFYITKGVREWKRKIQNGAKL
jgi:hypothetical protein